MQLAERLGYAEETDHHGHEGDAVPQFDDAEREALLKRQRVEADRADQHAESARDDALRKALARQRAHQQDAEHAEQHVVARLKGERQVRNQRRRNREHEDTHEAADHRHHRRDADRLAGLASLRQGIAVKGGSDCRGRAGDVEEDRRP